MRDTVNYSYFPTKYQAAIFRNWGSVEASRIAAALRTTEETVRACAAEMGLDPNEPCDPLWRSHGYVTIIRQNWYLLPEEQILTLLDWTAEKYAFSLKEDDFLYISIPGPSDLSRFYWKLGRKHGLRCAAKIQVNNSWEMSATPYLPVYDLVSEHLDNLIGEDVSALFLSWSLGGYPTENLKLLSKRFWSDEDKNAEDAESPNRKAQSIFSEAFRHFPFCVHALYYAPQNVGPANPLFIEPSGFDATMVCYPHDHLKKWRGVYPEDVFEHQFDLLCRRWKEGIDYLEQNAPGEEELCNIAPAVYNHFKSAHLQILFVQHRDTIGKDAFLADLAREELALVYSQIACCAKDSRIGFEASNHYFYNQQTLLEAAVSCEYVIEKIKK